MYRRESVRARGFVGITVTHAVPQKKKPQTNEPVLQAYTLSMLADKIKL